MYLIFDTETTGFVKKDVPPNHPSQARVVQLGWALLDEHLNEVAAFSSLVKPDNGWQISSGAQGVHGISTEMCIRYGLPLVDVIGLFQAARSNAKVMVAHNFAFDVQLLAIELENSKAPKSATQRAVCTMELMTPICKLPPTGNRSGYKWPKLAEAYRYVTQKEMQGAHDALSDVRGCADVLRWLVANRHVEV